MMVTEWSFPALDSGLPCTKGAGQRFRTQAERTQATDTYARTILSLSFMIGYDYFMWVDQPVLGISSAFPENSNYGITNEDGVPYAGLVRVLSKINLQDAPHIHRTGKTGIPAPATAAEAKPPDEPVGTEWVLWNKSDKALLAGPAYLPVKSGKPFSWAVRDGKRWRNVPTGANGTLARLPERAKHRSGPTPEP